MRLRIWPARRSGPPNIRLRRWIAFMLIALGLLWAFAGWVTFQDGYNLLQTGKRDTTAGRPTKTLITHLQEERRATVVYLGGRARGASPADMQAKRARTDTMIKQWRESASQAPGSKIRRYVNATAQNLDTLARARAAVDAGSVNRGNAVQPYNEAIDSALLINSANAELDDLDIAADGRALISLTRARELLAREDAEMAGSLAEGRFRSGEFTRFAQAVALRSQGEQDALPQLPDADRARLQNLHSGTAYTTLERLEKQVLTQPHPQGRIGVTAPQWQAATEPLLEQLDQAIDQGGDAVVQRGNQLAVGVILRFLLVCVLGGAAFALSVAVAITSTRRLLRQLNRLREAADDTVDQRLPGVMERLSRGESVDVAAEAPPLDFGDDEVGRVGHAFNRMREAAITAAAGQAELRETSRAILLALAMRSRGLIDQQISRITRMERRRDLDEQAIRELFSLDELTVRGRRHVNNLAMLAGSPAAHRAQRPVPLLDVVRAAMGQVVNYERIQPEPGAFQPWWLVGHAVDDVASILAELLDNAVSFSPPDTVVGVSSTSAAKGVAISIHDGGLGLSPEDLDRINLFLQTSPEFLAAQAGTDSQVRLGHLVIAMRARRVGVRVSLRDSAYGGVTAVVLIPHHLLSDSPDDLFPGGAQISASPRPAAPEAAATETGTGGVAVLTRAERPALAAVDTDEAPEAAGPQPVDDSGSPLTPGGLPVRVPQTHLAEPLRTDEPTPAQSEEDDLPDPERAGRVMGAFQRGTAEGRAQAIQDAQREPQPRTEEPPHNGDQPAPAPGREADTPPSEDH